MHTPIYISPSKQFYPHPWHPSVIYVPQGWNGHSFWMVETPLPPKTKPYTDRWELPCVHFSDDGISWSNIGHNPISDITEEQIAGYGYLSDPHLLLVEGRLECWYRRMLNHDTQTTILRKISLNGEDWSKEEVIADTLHLPIQQNLGSQIISPAILWKDNQYIMYYVDDAHENMRRGICRAFSTNGTDWSAVEQVCWQTSKSEKERVIPWHIDVQYIDNTYYLIIYDVDHNVVALYSSKDGLSFDNENIVLRLSSKWLDFYTSRLYRSCLVKVEDKWRIYFSGTTWMKMYIGLIESVDGQHFYSVEGRYGWKKICYVIDFVFLRFVQFLQRCLHYIDKHIICKFK